MGPVVLTLLLALLAAAAVVLLGATATGAGRTAGPREFVEDLRGGLRRPGLSRPLMRSAEDEDEDDEDETSVEDLFRVGRPDPLGYVDPAELAETLQRARGAVRAVAPASRR